MTVFKVNNRPVAKSWNGLVNDLFADFDNNFGAAFTQGNQVPVNISESENAYQIELAAPGRAKDSFAINVENNVLTISNEVKNETTATENNDGVKSIRKEFSYKSFRRSFSLDDKVNADAIEARYDNGILTVNLPKKAEVKPEVKQISIQ